MKVVKNQDKTNDRLFRKDIVWGLVEWFFGALLLVYAFLSTHITYRISDITSTGDTLYIEGFGSGIFLLVYGVGIALMCFGYVNFSSKDKPCS